MGRCCRAPRIASGFGANPSSVSSGRFRLVAGGPGAKVSITGAGGAGGVNGSVLQALMPMLLSDRLDIPVSARPVETPR